jgi:putative membrane protein
MKTNYLSHGLIAAMALVGCSTAWAADQNNQMDRKDTSFLKEAARGNESEVQMGQLGQEKAQNTEVKQLAQRLQQDHTKANQDLMQIAQKEGVTLPSETRKEEREATRLQDQTGPNFDKAFAEYAIKDHEKDIEKYQKALQNCKDPALQAYIQQNLPVLKEHLQMARNAGAAVGVDQHLLNSADRFLANNGGTGLNQGVGTGPGAQSGTGSTVPGSQRDLNPNSTTSGNPPK